MLDEILAHLRNYFVSSSISGTFEIRNGRVTTPALPEGQYFRIVGSVFNDGVYNSAEGFTDEVFDGEIWMLAIPNDLLTLAEEIKVYNESDMAKQTPYVSESYFGQYSYTRASGASGVLLFSWQDVFAKKLNRWRKI